MKTLVELHIVSASTSHAILRKEWNALLPCFPGMEVSDGALHRNEELLKVKGVTLCTTERDPVLLVHLGDYIVEDDEKARTAGDVFRTHGWR